MTSYNSLKLFECVPFLPSDMKGLTSDMLQLPSSLHVNGVCNWNCHFWIIFFLISHLFGVCDAPNTSACMLSSSVSVVCVSSNFSLSTSLG